jgi:glycogen(starch) synthase
MTRILHVLDHSLPIHSGYTFRTRAILKAQQSMGLEVRGVTGPRYNDGDTLVEEHDGLLFHRAAGKPRGVPILREWHEIALFAQAIERVVAEWRPDVIHAHSPVLCGQAALRVARRHGLPLVYEIRAFWEDAAVGNGTGTQGSFKYRLTRALETHVVSRADAVVTICQGLRADLIGRGIAQDRISVMPNGVDLKLFGTPLPRDPVIADGRTGILFRPDDVQACADSLARLLDARADWDVYRRSAREHVEIGHDWARNARRYSVIYQMMAARTNHAGLAA